MIFNNDQFEKLENAIGEEKVTLFFETTAEFKANYFLGKQSTLKNITTLENLISEHREAFNEFISPFMVNGLINELNAAKTKFNTEESN